MDQSLKTGGIIIVLILCGLWIMHGYKSTRLGATGNNGVSADMPKMSPTLQKNFENMAEKHKNDPPPEMPNMDDPKQMQEIRSKIEAEISPEQKEEFRKMSADFGAKMGRARAAMSPADQARMRQKMAERFGMRGGGPPR